MNLLIYDGEINRNLLQLIRILGGDEQFTIRCELFKESFPQDFWHLSKVDSLLSIPSDGDVNII
jgi:hypothetical protein